MNPKETLRPYIEAHLKHGTSADVIKQQLTGQGWSADIVDETISDVRQALQQTSVAIQQSAIDQPVASESYGLLQAFPDAFAALGRNASSITIFSVISILLPSIAAITLAIVGARIATARYVDTLFMANPAEKNIFTTEVVLLLALALVITVIFSVYSQALIGIAINDGAEGKKSKIKPTLVIALRRTPRVGLAMLIYLLILAIPALLVTGLAALALTNLPSFSIAVYVLGGLALVAIYLFSLQFALLPLVALFEPTVKSKRLLGRARQLMAGGGIWFYARLVLVGYIINLIASLALRSDQDDPLPTMIALALALFTISIITSIITMTTAVVFYRNRKVIKG